MATKGPLFIHLESRVKDLDGKFIADQVTAEQNDPATYLPDIDQIAAFRLLVHAEIEDYLERKAKEAIYQLRGKLANTAFNIRGNLDLFVLASRFEIVVSHVIPFDLTKLKESLDNAIREAEKFVDANNGIKEPSFTTLALICGKMADELDVALLTSLNQYGKGRGDVAHKSASRVTTISAPSAERKDASELIKALELFFY